MPKLRTLIYALTGIVVLLSLSMVFVLNRANHRVDALSQVILTNSHLQQQVMRLTALLPGMAEANPRALQQWDKNLEAIDKALLLLTDSMSNQEILGQLLQPEQPFRLSQNVKRIRILSDKIEQVTNLTNNPISSHSQAVLRNQLISETSLLSESLYRIGDQLIQKTGEQSKAGLNNLSMIVGVFLVSMLAILGVIAYAIILKLNSLSTAANAFRQGQLDIRLPVKGKSEIDQAFQSFNQMAASLSNAQTALVDSNNRLEMAALVSGLGIWEWRLDRGKILWDRRMHAIHGLPSEDAELTFDTWANTFHPEDRDRVIDSLRQVLESAAEWDNEFRIIREDGDIRFIRASARINRDPHGEAVSVTGGYLDITDQRMLDARLRESADAAEKATRAKSEFLANMSHEIRTPMNGVLGLTELLQTTPISPLQAEYLRMIKSSAQSLLTVLNDILDLSKIEAGHLAIEPIPMSLDLHVGDLVKGFALEAQGKSIELGYSVDMDVPDCVELDPNRLSQILFNLIGNAVKFTERGSVQLRISASASRSESSLPLLLHIVVRDTGVGISEAKRQEVFEPFRQADGSVSRQYGGTGLGLSIVTQLVSLMGGQINLDSELGKGTTVSVTLPTRPGDCEEDLFQEPEWLQPEQLKCLIIEESADNRRWLKDIVESWGGAAHLCTSMDEAMAHLQANPPPHYRITLLSENLDQESALSSIESHPEITQQSDSIILLFSPGGLEEKLLAARRLGITRHLVKPVKQSEVYNAIISALSELGRRIRPLDDMIHPGSRKALNILVAEDNEVNQVVVEGILTARGHQVTLVENGQQAVAMLEKEPFDVVLMDVQMPLMDGLEATKNIRKYQQSFGPRCPIIGLTAHALEGDREMCLKAGMDDYLTKPILPTLLISTVESWYEHGKPPAEKSSQQQPKPQMIDLEKARTMTNGDELLIRKMLSTLLDLLPDMEKETDHFLQIAEYERALRCLHKLKGTASNVANKKLIQKMSALEDVLEIKGIAWERMWSQLKTDFTQLQTEIKLYLSSHEVTG